MAEPIISVLNGPNLNLLGERDPLQYGKVTLEAVEKSIQSRAKQLKLSVDFFQSNSEGAIVDRIQQIFRDTSVAGLIINPAAYTHTSIALRDALEPLTIPKIEVHLSNIYSREEFRRHSYVSAVVTATIAGFGADGYLFALEALAKMLAGKD